VDTSGVSEVENPQLW